MIIVDLECGKKGFSRPFADRGHEVYTVDIDPVFEPTVVADVRTLRWPVLDIQREVDCVLAAPPCQKFSVAAAGHYWPGGVPKPEVVDAIGLVASTLRLIAEIAPRFWVMENPTGMLRNVIGPPCERVYLCSFGAIWKKPTDLWGTWPGRIRRPCAPHQAAPRGSKTGIQSTEDPADRAELPYGLGEELCRRMEDALAGRPVDPARSTARSTAVDRELPLQPVDPRRPPAGVTPFQVEP